MPIAFTLNGRPAALASTDDAGLLLWALRTELGLTGTKYGCGEGICGLCTVLVDGVPTRSCMTPVSAIAGRDVLTVEGLGTPRSLSPLQQAFVDQGAVQCGYCTPGMLVTAHALLETHPAPTHEQIVSAMDPVLCRCGAHQRIVAAITAAAAAAHDPKGGR